MSMVPCRVVILGGKGTAVNIAEQIDHAYRNYQYPMTVEGFGIDDPGLGNSIAGFPVICGLHDAWPKYRDTQVQFIFALYKPDVMERRVALLRQLGIPTERYANFIHPTAYRSGSAIFGHGNVILSNASLQHNVRLGNHNIVNSNVVIEHEATLSNSVFIAAAACIGARVAIGDGSFVGLSATVREDVSIGAYSFVGMASAVLHDVAPRNTVYGLPASTKS
ncbi:sialic acid O-acetyltransferase [Rhodoferax ferrireducens]|uniref:sialic acid O-acetyltransferase n=1 Tax=Rhodoferax ferrireducens TaxID=192843 RepID=UPI000E0D9353|nr:sialic acid O-acetyltransferase [Rhodoferax ferrireducens]